MSEEKCRERILFYGLGEQFQQYVIRNQFVRDQLKKYDIVGFIDREKQGQEFVFNGKIYKVLSPKQWTDVSVDKVIISTVKYCDEVKSILKACGFCDEQIWTIESALICFFDSISCIQSCIEGNGLEIGGPSAVFSYIYNTCQRCDGVNFRADTLWWKQSDSDRYLCENREMGKIYIADATNLMRVSDESYDFVLSSNNLEHIANPIKAFKEFCRVVKKGGIVVVVVPRKDINFDHNREYTPFDHLLADYDSDIAEDDLSHLSEIIELHDYELDPACGGRETFLQRAYHNFENRCLHHHVFDRKCLTELFHYFHLEILEFAETYGDYWMIGRK